MSLLARCGFCFLAFRTSILLWFVFYFNLNTYSQELKLRFNHLTTEEGLSQNTINGIVKDKYGFMWFGTWGGLNKFDGYKFTVYNADIANPKAIPSNRIISVMKDSSEMIWAMTFDSMIVRYNYESDDFTRFDKKNFPSSLLDLFAPQRKTVAYHYEWKGIYNIIKQTNLTNQNVINYVNNPFDKWSVHLSYSYWQYVDDNQIFWVGGYYYGICFADILQKPFNCFYVTSLKSQKNITLDDKIRAIGEDHEGNLWIGTSEWGISRYHQKTNAFTHFQHDPTDTTNRNRLFFLNHIRSIYCDRYGYVWIGSGAGIRKYDSKTNQYSYYWLQPELNTPNTSVRSIIEDYRGNLWACTRTAIYKYDRRNDRFIAYKASDFMGVDQPRFRILIEDKRRNFWISTENYGLVCIKHEQTMDIKEKLTSTIYKNSITDKNSLGDNCIYHVYEDEYGNIWSGANTGLTRFDPVHNKFVRINKSKGLASEFIQGILGDLHGNIWVSHKKGLSKINIQTLGIQNYTTDDGLVSNEFMENACYRDNKTGTLYFGNLNGLVYFNPDSINDNPYPPRLVLTELYIDHQPVKLNQPHNGRIVLTKPVTLTKEITLCHEDKSFSLEFSALHFSCPKKNNFAYMLKGYDNKWINTDAASRKVTYSNLPPGHYVFLLKGSNNDGVWSKEPISLKIHILSPWWQTWWAKLLFLLIFASSIYIAYNVRVALYRKKQKELSTLVKLRTFEISHANDVLLERQTRIEEYAEELRTHSENLREANELLMDKQKLIETQATQLKDANEQLKKTNEQLAIFNSTKDRFFSIIAHDLRNPFHTVGGFAEILLKDYKQLPPEKIERFLSLIYTSSITGNNLLENLLQWSRSQTGRINYNPEKYNIFTIAEETLYLLEGDMHRKNLTVHQLIDSAITVFADDNMLKTIFRNLLSNAIKFSYVDGSITLKSNVISDFVEIAIIDTGVGIPPEKLPLLFQIHTAVSTKGTANETGTGLGLIICKEFVEKHNGKIWIESEGGKGCTFKFTLPLG